MRIAFSMAMLAFVAACTNPPGFNPEPAVKTATKNLRDDTAACADYKREAERLVRENVGRTYEVFSKSPKECRKSGS